MARGYPEPRAPKEDAPPSLLPADVCMICKKRPALRGQIKCADCAALLGGG